MSLNSDSALNDGRPIKRIRQACENCRRKKTRCSGEKPICGFCSRLGQTCVYQNTNHMAQSSHSQSYPLHYSDSQVLAAKRENALLVARLAAIESRLGLTSDGNHKERSLDRGVPYTSLRESVEQSENERAPDPPGVTEDESDKFSTLPPRPILEDMIKVYFTYCHNQPYCFFLEPAFRRRFAEGTLPDYLLLAFVATAARYSKHPYFENRQNEAMERYAKSAWLVILKQVFSSEQGLDLFAVQATNLLAVIDFTAGQHRLGWIKIGLVTRFAQGLRLNAEPDPNLTVWEQEEHRRVFWSVYVLDRFVCFSGRSPSIADADCTITFPSSAELSDTSTRPQDNTSNLASLKRLPELSPFKGLNHFALLVLASSLLGRVVKCNHQQNNAKTWPPWDFRSDHAKTSTMLLSFETLLSIEGLDLAVSVQQDQVPDGGFDTPSTGHFIWSRGVYHLARCLSSHPLLLYRHLQYYKDSFPRSFARSILQSCHEHARHLTSILKVVLETKCCVRGSFLGYFAVTAGSVHHMFQYSVDPKEKLQAQKSLQTCLDFLERDPVHWSNYPRMAIALREFQVDPSTALALIESRFSDQIIETTKLETWSHILDYGWLSDASRTGKSVAIQTPQMNDPRSWDFFEDLLGDGINGSFDIAGSSLDSFMNVKAGRPADWWYSS